MTRLLTCGYETGDIAEAGVSTIGASMALTVVSNTPTPRSPGSYCLKLAITSGNNFTITHKAFAFPTTKTEVWVRFALFAHAAAGPYQIAALLDSASGTQTSLTYTPADGLLRLWRGSSSAGTQVGTATLSFPQDTWHVIDWRTQLLTTTTGTSEVWLDGAQVINFSGDNSGTVTLNLLTVLVGSSVSNPTIGQSTSTYLAFDDIAVNDTAGSINTGQIGDGRVVLLKPNGAGSNTALTRGGTDTGVNYSQVSELPPSMTQYVYSATPATRDTYALEDVPSGSWTVNCCEVLALGQNSDSGTGSLGLTVKSGATTNEGTAQNLSTTAAYFRQLYETDPATSTAWTVSAVSALEAGVTVR